MTAVVVEQATGGWRSPLPWTLSLVVPHLCPPSSRSPWIAAPPLCCMCLPVIPGPRGGVRSCSHQAPRQAAHSVVSRAHSQVWGLEALAGGCEQTTRVSSLTCGPHTPAGHTQMWYARVTLGHRASPPVAVTQLRKPRASAPVVPVEDVRTVAWAQSLSGTVRTCPLCRARLSCLSASRCLRDGRPLSGTLIVLPAGSSHTQFHGTRCHWAAWMVPAGGDAWFFCHSRPVYSHPSSSVPFEKSYVGMPPGRIHSLLNKN